MWGCSKQQLSPPSEPCNWTWSFLTCIFCWDFTCTWNTQAHDIPRYRLQILAVPIWRLWTSLLSQPLKLTLPVILSLYFKPFCCNGRISILLWMWGLESHSKTDQRDRLFTPKRIALCSMCIEIDTSLRKSSRESCKKISDRSDREEWSKSLQEPVSKLLHWTPKHRRRKPWRTALYLLKAS